LDKFLFNFTVVFFSLFLAVHPEFFYLSGIVIFAFKLFWVLYIEWVLVCLNKKSYLIFTLFTFLPSQRDTLFVVSWEADPTTLILSRKRSEKAEIFHSNSLARDPYKGNCCDGL